MVLVLYPFNYKYDIIMLILLKGGARLMPAIHLVHRADIAIMIGSFIFCSLLAYKPEWITFKKLPDYVHHDDIAMVAFMLFLVITVFVLKHENLL